MKKTIAVITRGTSTGLMKKFVGISAVAALVVMPQAAQAATDAATYGDRHVIQGNFQSGASDVFLAGNSNGRRVGAGGPGGNNRVNNPIIQFTLPTLTGGSLITGADFSLTWDDPAITSGANFDGIVTLMNYDSTNDFSGADFNDDLSSLGSGSLAGTFTTKDVSNGGTLNLSLGAPALSLLQSFYTGVNPNQSSVFFRLSMDGTHVYPAMEQDRYNIETVGGASGGDLITTFTISNIVPEPTTLSLALLGAGGLLALRRRNKS